LKFAFARPPRPRELGVVEETRLSFNAFLIWGSGLHRGPTPRGFGAAAHRGFE